MTSIGSCRWQKQNLCLFKTNKMEIFNWKIHKIEIEIVAVGMQITTIDKFYVFNYYKKAHSELLYHVFIEKSFKKIRCSCMLIKKYTKSLVIVKLSKLIENRRFFPETKF